MSAKFLIVLFPLCLLSCSSINSQLPSYASMLHLQSGQNGRSCIRENDIRGYGVLGRSVISISTRKPGKYYLATTSYRCDSLEFSGAVAFVGSFSEFCGGGRDRVYTGAENCPVKHIFEYESREHAFEAFDRIKAEREQLKAKLKAEKQALKTTKV